MSKSIIELSKASKNYGCSIGFLIGFVVGILFCIISFYVHNNS